MRRLSLLGLIALLFLSEAAGSAEPAKPAAASSRPAARAPRQPSPALAPIVDDAKLPRVLLIGDSISIGYTLPVRAKLEGRANVHRIPTNGGPTSNPLTKSPDGVANMDRWLGDSKWDVIHFNWGLHDLKYMPEGTRQISPENYEKNLTLLVERLKKTGAKLIWCSTTPVPAGDLTPKRTQADVVAYNQIAARVMEQAGVEVDDLYSYALPKLTEIQLPVNVHFSETGSAVLAEQVAAEIEKRLPPKRESIGK